ncbi:DPCD family protein [Spironucleus salmonicida]|uniref:Protein DPCD n=1 Tax=Spironucleus salmonicida TaxID=348837 RepID=V6LSF9_9EUKA|nr:DPCD family protein [Spironucleus salmonicida]|eukprot:EST46646.1 hypothetical protein SS50377_13449 [Spironucleus salmonicida]
MSLLLPGGKKNAYIQNNLQKIHTIFPDGSECIEEFHTTEQLYVSRKWRKVDQMGRLSDWSVEIGEVEQKKEIFTGLFESADTPIVNRLDSEGYYIFKITNLPPPESNYRVDVDAKDLIIRTTNKKYFKKIQINDLEWQNIPLVQQFVKVKHHNNCLMVFYQKPPGMVQFEKAARQARLQGFQNKKEGECPGQ